MIDMMMERLIKSGRCFRNGHSDCHGNCEVQKEDGTKTTTACMCWCHLNQHKLSDTLNHYNCQIDNQQNEGEKK